MFDYQRTSVFTDLIRFLVAPTKMSHSDVMSCSQKRPAHSTGNAGF